MGKLKWTISGLLAVQLLQTKALTLNKSSFRGNGLPGESASAGVNTFTAGGAIWQKNSSLIIDSCCFEKMHQMMVEQCTHYK